MINVQVNISILLIHSYSGVFVRVGITSGETSKLVSHDYNGNNDDDQPSPKKIFLELSDSAHGYGILEMYRQDETVAVVVKLDDITFMERVKIDPRKWTSSVTSLSKNIRNIYQ